MVLCSPVTPAASLQAQPILSEVTGSSEHQRWQIPPPTAPSPSFLMAPASAPFPHFDSPQSLSPSHPRGFSPLLASSSSTVPGPELHSPEGIAIPVAGEEHPSDSVFASSTENGQGVLLFYTATLSKHLKPSLVKNLEYLSRCLDWTAVVSH